MKNYKGMEVEFRAFDSESVALINCVGTLLEFINTDSGVMAVVMTDYGKDGDYFFEVVPIYRVQMTKEEVLEHKLFN